ncbi:MAG: mechanosensitive ion channel family protein [Thermoplasmata archaeon]|nr:mechanosensitive ion channel family protein [Thermoplasmata archaeon]
MDSNIILDFIFQHGLYIAILILILVCLGLGLSYISEWFRKIQKIVIKSKSKYLDKSIIEVIQLLMNIIFSICILMITILVTASFYPTFKDFFWDTFSNYFTPLVSMIITLIIIFILSQVIHRFFRFLRITLKKRPGAVLKAETTRFVELSLVYLVYIIGLTIVLIIGFAAIGLSDPIRGSLVYFFENYLSSVILIIIALVIIYAISRFVTAFINDLKAEPTRYNPATLDLTRNMVTYILLIIAILIVVLSIFSFSGLGQLSEAILLTIIIVVGLILAMSASGAMGNFFSGLVLMFTSPYEPGDSIKIGNGTLGRVKTKQLFSTIIISEDDEEIKFPNSKLLDSQIVNYSRTDHVPISIDVKVNYKVTSKRVHSLLQAAAEKTDSVNLDERPPKIYTVKFEPTSIKYRLLVYIDKVSDREEVNTNLLDNIQEIFNEAEVSFKG